MAISKEIEIINFSSAKQRSPHNPNSIWLGKKKADTGKEMYHSVIIGSDLIKQCALMDNDKLQLGKVSGSNLYVFQPCKSPDAFTIKPYGTSGDIKRINNRELAAYLHYHLQGEEFDAWVDDFCIYFRKKEQ